MGVNGDSPLTTALEDQGARVGVGPDQAGPGRDRVQEPGSDASVHEPKSGR